MTRPDHAQPPGGSLNSVVIIVDDDAGIRASLDSLFRSVGLETRLFGSPAELLGGSLPDGPGCIVLDIRLPGVSGLDLQSQLVRQGISYPIIFMTGHGDIPMSVRAMKAGAVDFLSKPFRDQDMLDAVAVAIERDRTRRKEEKIVAELRAVFETLTTRERDVLALVASGLMNKQIAAEIGLAEITVKIHRGHLMRKMGARSLADLVRMAEMLGIRRAKP
jgi:FixJ family two-component response regulator